MSSGFHAPLTSTTTLRGRVPTDCALNQQVRPIARGPRDRVDLYLAVDERTAAADSFSQPAGEFVADLVLGLRKPIRGGVPQCGAKGKAPRISASIAVSVSRTTPRKATASGT